MGSALEEELPPGSAVPAVMRAPCALTCPIASRAFPTVPTVTRCAEDSLRTDRGPANED